MYYSYEYDFFAFSIRGKFRRLADRGPGLPFCHRAAGGGLLLRKPRKPLKTPKTPKTQLNKTNNNNNNSINNLEAQLPELRPHLC